MNILRRIWEWWKPVGQIIGDFIGRVILTIFYFTIFLPFGIGVTLFGDSLDIKDKTGPVWLTRTSSQSTIQDSKRLF